MTKGTIDWLEERLSDRHYRTAVALPSCDSAKRNREGRAVGEAMAGDWEVSRPRHEKRTGSIGSFALPINSLLDAEKRKPSSRLSRHPPTDEWPHPVALPPTAGTRRPPRRTRCKAC